MKDEVSVNRLHSQGERGSTEHGKNKKHLSKFVFDEEEK